MIFSLDPNSPAFDVNLRETDVLIEINGHNVRKMKTAKVLKLIDATLANGSIEILAIESKGYSILKKNGQKLSSKLLPNPGNTLTFRSEQEKEADDQSPETSAEATDEEPPVPRICALTGLNKDTELGFNLLTSKTLKGVIKLSKIVDGSAAAKAGIRDDDYVIEISGEPVRYMSGRQVIEFIKKKKAENDLQFLVIDRAGLEWYESRKIRISSLMGLRQPQQEHEDSEVEVEEMQKNVSFNTVPGLGKNEVNYDFINVVLSRGRNEPLGMSLEMWEGTVSKGGNKSVVSLSPRIARVEENGLAELSGLRAGDVILEVNGKKTVGKSNKKISEWIKKGKSNLVFAVKRKANMEDCVVAEIIGETVEEESNPFVNEEEPAMEAENVSAVEVEILGKDNEGYVRSEEVIDLKKVARDLACEALNSSLVLIRDEKL